MVVHVISYIMRFRVISYCMRCFSQLYLACARFVAFGGSSVLIPSDALVVAVELLLCEVGELVVRDGERALAGGVLPHVLRYKRLVGGEHLRSADSDGGSVTP